MLLIDLKRMRIPLLQNGFILWREFFNCSAQVFLIYPICNFFVVHLYSILSREISGVFTSNWPYFVCHYVYIFFRLHICICYVRNTNSTQCWLGNQPSRPAASLTHDCLCSSKLKSTIGLDDRVQNIDKVHLTETAAKV